MASTKTNSQPTLTSRSVKIYYEFKIDDNNYQVIESYDGNNEICFREIKKLDWGGTCIVNNESLTIELPSYVSRWATDFIVTATAIYYLKIKIYAVSRVDENGKFNVYGENGSFNWIAIGKRDSLIAEPLKSEINVKGSGPYKWIE